MRCPECNSGPFKSLGTWKRHMSTWHKGYTDEQLHQAAGVAPAEPVRERMHRLSQSLPEAATVIPQVDSGPEETKAPPAPAQEPEKRVKATPKKLRKLIATLPAQWFEQQGIKLDEEDQSAIEEAVEFIENVFGFEFVVPADKFVIRSRIWAILWPIGVFLFIFVKHRAKGVIAPLEELHSEKHDNGTHSAEGSGENPQGS